MLNCSDKITGALIAAAGLLAYFAFIPNGVETVDSGWVKPDTIPNILAWVWVIFGVILVLKPTEHSPRNLKQFGMFALYFALLCVGLYAISLFGFLYVAPILALTLMMFMGERRPFWLLIGCAGLPAVIWITVVWLLERGLP